MGYIDNVNGYVKICDVYVDVVGILLVIDKILLIGSVGVVEVCFNISVGKDLSLGLKVGIGV